MSWWALIAGVASPRWPCRMERSGGGRRAATGAGPRFCSPPWRPPFSALPASSHTCRALPGRRHAWRLVAAPDGKQRPAGGSSSSWCSSSTSQIAWSSPSSRGPAGDDRGDAIASVRRLVGGGLRGLELFRWTRAEHAVHVALPLVLLGASASATSCTRSTGAMSGTAAGGCWPCSCSASWSGWRRSACSSPGSTTREADRRRRCRRSPCSAWSSCHWPI